MNRITRAAIVGALASAVALGVSGPADAAPVGKAGHHKVHTAKAAKSAKATKGGKSVTGKAAKADQQLARAKRKLAGEIARKNRFLGNLLERDGVERLDDVVETALRVNVDSDRAALAVLRISADEAAVRGELQEVAADARGIRPERYNTIVNQLRKAGELLAAAEGDAEATSALDAVLAELVTFSARTSRIDLQAAQRALAAVAETLEETTDETGETGTEPVSAV